MGIHDGHRERMKKRFLEHGLDNFDDVNALELLLFYALPRKDTNALAHALLDRFGSLAGVLDASAADLLSVDGVGESIAGLLRLIPEMSRRYIVSKTRPILCREIGRGTVDAAQISARKLASLCLERRASSVIVAHNPPSGNALPSEEDVAFTTRLGEALSVLGVELSDHIIVAGTDYVSLREAELM